MPISYHLHRSWIEVRPTGAVDAAEIRRTFEALIADPAIAPGMDLLSDSSALDTASTTAIVKSVIPLIERLAERIGSFRLALVAPGDATYGMGRMTEALSAQAPVSVRVFRARRDAEAWLSAADRGQRSEPSSDA